jgi:Ca2+-binding EF-hand superfamily protein
MGDMHLKAQAPGQQRPPPPPKGPSPTGVPPRRISPSAPPVSGSPRPPSQPQVGRRQTSSVPPGVQASNMAARFHSPPPANYGHGPRPIANRPPPRSIPPQSPANQYPPSGPLSDDPNQLMPLFRAANVSNSGALTEAELGSALVNGDYSAFDPNTVKMMVRMFDRNGDGVIGFEEFGSLWRFLAAWRELFDRFDEDRSGRISLDEFEKALVAFGYRLSRAFVRVLFSTFESKGRRRTAAGPYAGHGGMSFDLFVQACISLKRMTDVFKRYDDDRDGYITVSFEEFLTGTCRLCVEANLGSLVDPS